MSMCRLCLSCDTNISELSDIYGTRLHDILEKLTGILMFQGDGLPHTICSMCKSYLNKSYQLWKRSTTANKILTMMQASQMEITPEVVRQIDRQGYQLCYDYKPFYPPGVNCLDNELIVTEETQNQDDSIQTEVFEPPIVTETPQATELETVETEVSKDTNCQEDEETPDETELPEEAHSQEEPEFEETFEVQEEQETQDQPESPEAAEDDDSDHRPPSGKETSVVNEIPMEIDLTEADLPAAPKAKRKNDNFQWYEMPLTDKADSSGANQEVHSDTTLLICTKNKKDKLRKPKRLTCNYCKKMYNSKTFRAHVNGLCKNSEDKPITNSDGYACEECDFETDQEIYLKMHMATHVDKKNKKTKEDIHVVHPKANKKEYSCQKCLSICSDKTAFLKHKCMYRCTSIYCSYKTMNKSEFDHHVRAHSKKKPFKCEYCNFETANREELLAHAKVHLPSGTAAARGREKQFVCVECTKVFGSRQTLKMHITSAHHKHCPMCDFKCTLKYKLDLHMVKHGVNDGKIKLYECKECEFNTIFELSLQSHMLSHVERRMQCAHCRRRFSRKENLIKHVKMHMREKTQRKVHRSRR